jgi:hypothetical protein
LGQRAAVIGGWLLDAVLIIRLFSIDVVTGQFVEHWRKTGQPT